MRRLLRLPLRLLNWIHKGKRLWVACHCHSAGAGILVYRVRGDELRHEGLRLPCLRLEAFWGEQLMCQRPRYGVELSLERWARDER